MGASIIPLLLFTALWAIVGIVLPIFVPRSTNRGILQVMLMLTAFTCWLFWLCCYMAQMNPLIGPKLPKNTVLMMAREWSHVQFNQ
ncbi:V-type proton ATPase subunit e-like [Bombus pascuorum]|uniref:V-type proton ATPase subunit e-like n=1 Tax=Bombus pascuorum TaxID=65598 RepID=UPI00298D84BF|nr:V-type proton ATPase subunit e-like [Bombus pascuorum]